MANYYTAVTIGPIGDTMALITKPAALWAASAMFSAISRRICETAVETHGIDPLNMITPFFPTAEEASDKARFYERKDGVGLFHDHIIVKDNDKAFYHALPAIKADVLRSIAEDFELSAEALDQYIMIAPCVFDLPAGGNPILHCGKMLDCLELPKVFAPTEKTHPIIGALSNDAVQRAAQRLGVDNALWQLTRGSSVRDLGHIAAAANAPGLKKNRYFCILRADGDNIGKVIAALENDGQCRDFSRVCLSYCDEVTKAVGHYGGVTIYAGGDDLFAIVPCEGGEGERASVFGLIGQITEIFDRQFKGYTDLLRAQGCEHLPHLSFGLAICYRAYPLYEAVELSGRLLFGVAKQTKEKNCIAVRLQKHSGQSRELLITQQALPAFTGLLDEIRLAGSSDEVLLSAAQKLLLYRQLLDMAHTEEMVRNLFTNIFDADFHHGSGAAFLHNTLPGFFCRCCRDGMIVSHEEGRAADDRAKTMSQILQLMKFFVEKGEY